MWKMWNVTPVTHKRTDSRKVEQYSVWTESATVFFYASPYLLLQHWALFSYFKNTFADILAPQKGFLPNIFWIHLFNILASQAYSFPNSLACLKYFCSIFQPLKNIPCQIPGSFQLWVCSACFVVGTLPALIVHRDTRQRFSTKVVHI